MKIRFTLNSVISRLFLSFFIIIAPILATGTTMFIWGRNAIKTEIVNSARNDVAFQKNNLVSEIQNIKMLQYSLINDKTINKLVNEYTILPQYEMLNMIAEVETRLEVMQSSNTYIEQATIYIPALGHSISTSMAYSVYSEDEYVGYLNKSLSNSQPVVCDDTGMYAVMAYPSVAGKENPPLYLVVIKISDMKIQNFLNTFGVGTESKIVFYDHSSGIWKTDSQVSLSKKDWEGLKNTAQKNSLDFTGSVAGKKYCVVASYSNFLDYTFFEYIPLGDIFRIPDRYNIFLWVYFSLSVLIIVLYALSTNKFIKIPIQQMLSAFRNVEKGDLNVNIHYKSTNEFNYLFEGFNKMVSRLSDLIDHVYRQEIYAKKIELKQLQSQINPHFFYNSHFMLSRMISGGDYENAQLLSEYIGNYFQYVTRSSADEVPLSKEYEHASVYVKIQTMRFAGRIRIELEPLPQTMNNIFVPRLILQPLLENSLEHGLRDKVECGIMRISFLQDENLHIVVEDNGDTITDQTISELNEKLSDFSGENETTGLLNVHRRIRFKFNEKSGILLSRSSLGGLKVEIVVEPIPEK